MVRSRVEDGVRALRLAVFSTAATVLALGAHVLGGGAPPELLATCAAVGVPGVAAVALSRRRRGPVEITVVLGAVQLVLHEVFAAGHVGASRVGAGHLGSGHLGSGDVGAGHAVEAASGAMIASHVLAVVLTALLLARGERMLHLLSSWWRALPAIARGHVAPVPVARHRIAVPADVRPVQDLPSYRAAAAVDRRGPPLSVC